MQRPVDYGVAVQFMCLPAVQDSPPDGSRQSQSFEEVRILDYLRSYHLTGRPPPPCPVEPSSALERTALGLPPAFEPWTDPTAPPPSTIGPVAPFPTNPGQPHPNVTRAVDPYMLTMEPVIRYRPEELPRVQVFTPVAAGGESFESIVCSPTFAWYSPEELRFLAYAHGLKQITAPVPTPPLAEVPGGNSTSGTPTLIINEEVNEVMDHISAHPDYLKHSPEELRLAFIRTGRQLTSQQLLVA